MPVAGPASFFGTMRLNLSGRLSCGWFRPALRHHLPYRRTIQ
ncbi:hypothetical protein GDI2563 [Gluconacetobacter diazotrophicus PA1 5]|uniref:Uncharacterized protein n=1 Tax=Gluconacetobacter diazotrophicus (strain ATCC 49037 / DSM 5601 / CCUG 37298 / CIP 103539 / LMG 7603 / PAl5) TaxID=272568 RepID=A9HNV0_GLUDA|nr:hypothetical protein GDI2563 [Gluconacetobacter diazotrophicus PA1 5]